MTCSSIAKYAPEDRESTVDMTDIVQDFALTMPGGKQIRAMRTISGFRIRFVSRETVGSLLQVIPVRATIGRKDMIPRRVGLSMYT